MKTHSFERAGSTLAGLGAVALIGFASWSGRAIANENLSPKTPNAVLKAGGKLGSVGALNFADLSGKTYTRSSIGSKATVFLFVSAQCPISNVYTPRFNALAADYAAKRRAGVRHLCGPSGERGRHRQTRQRPQTDVPGSQGRAWHAGGRARRED